MAVKNKKKPIKNIPVKETLNLAMKEKSPFSPIKVIPGIVAIVVLAALFSRFAVYELYLRLDRKNAELSGIQTEMDTYNAALVRYDDILLDYTHRSNDWMKEEEKNLVDYQVLYPMFERCVLPYSDISNASIRGNEMSLNLENLSLNNAAAIMQQLSARDDVESVSINTANRKDAQLTEERTGSATLRVVLKLAEDKEK